MIKIPQNKKLLGALNILLTIGVFYFAFVYGKSLVNQVDFAGLSLRWIWLALSLVLFVISYGLLSLHWLYICRMVAAETPKKQLLAFLASQPYKYLPSSIFTFSYRASYARKLGMPIKQSSIAQLIENLSILGVGILFAGLSYLIAYYSQLALLAVSVGLLVAVAVYRQNIIIVIPKTRYKIQTRELFPKLTLSLGFWIFSGLSFITINYALGLEINIWLMLSANAAAYVASILAFFAPGGIGIRELLLSLYSISSSVIVLWRLLTFIIDIILGFGVVILVKYKY